MDWLLSFVMKRIGSNALAQSDRVRVWLTSKLTAAITLAITTVAAVTVNKYCGGCVSTAQAAAFGATAGTYLAGKIVDSGAALITSIGNRDVVADGPKPPEPDLSAPVPDLPEVAVAKP